MSMVAIEMLVKIDTTNAGKGTLYRMSTRLGLLSQYSDISAD